MKTNLKNSDQMLDELQEKIKSGKLHFHEMPFIINGLLDEIISLGKRTLSVQQELIEERKAHIETTKRNKELQEKCALLKEKNRVLEKIAIEETKMKNDLLTSIDITKRNN